MKNNKSVAFFTLGCKVNQYETNGMAQEFKNNGYQIVQFEQKADIYIINTCTVTNMSDRKSRQCLRQAKKNNPLALVVAVRMLCSSCKIRSRKNTRDRFMFRN